MLFYIEKKSFFHCLDPKTKLFFFFLVSVFSVLSSDISYLFSLFMFNVLIFFANKLPLRDIYGFSKFFVIISAFVITFQGIFYPLGTTALFGFLPFTTEGIVFGIAISLRMFCILFSLSLLMLTTKQKDIMESLGNFLPKEISFSLSTAFRFIPILEKETKSIMIAQQTRGYSKRNLKKLTVHFPVIVPLLSKSLGMARTLAISVESRGFGRAKTKYNIKMKYYDWIVICVTFLFNVYLYLFYSA